MSLHIRFDCQPILALQFMFNESVGPNCNIWDIINRSQKRKTARVFVSYEQIGGGIAGSFKTVFADELINRKYKVLWCNNTLEIRYLDKMYDPRTFKHVDI